MIKRLVILSYFLSCLKTLAIYEDRMKIVFHSNELMGLLKEYNIPSVLVDMAGRRDLMHMRLTNNEAFIRYVVANQYKGSANVGRYYFK